MKNGTCSLKFFRPGHKIYRLINLLRDSDRSDFHDLSSDQLFYTLPLRKAVYANSTRSFFPRAEAARSSVERVTEVFAGSNNRSSDARLVLIRLAISIFVSLRRFISRSIWNASTRFTAVASTVCNSCSSRRKSSKLLPTCFLFIPLPLMQICQALAGCFQVCPLNLLRFFDKPMQQHHRVALNCE